MKAPDFAYERPTSLSDALALLADSSRDAMPLAGGQSLVPMMNFRVARPDLLVDLNAVPEIRGICAGDGTVEIGAMTRYAEIMGDADTMAQVPLFAKALPHVAHAAIRNRGTIGGSVSLADPAAEMPALLLALDAHIVTAGSGGSRRIAASEFFVGLYETALEPGELVTHISIPVAGEGARFGFHELARRHGDYAMAGVAVAAKGNPMQDVRVAFFSVADRALRAGGAEAALTGKAPDDAEAIAAAVESLGEIDFAGDLNGDAAAKRHWAGTVLKRALGEMAG